MTSLIEAMARAYWDKVADEHNCWSALGGDEKDAICKGMRAALQVIADAPPTAAMQQAVAINWGRRTWAEYRSMLRAELDADARSGK